MLVTELMLNTHVDRDRCRWSLGVLSEVLDLRTIKKSLHTGAAENNIIAPKAHLRSRQKNTIVSLWAVRVCLCVCPV